MPWATPHFVKDISLKNSGGEIPPFGRNDIYPSNCLSPLERASSPAGERRTVNHPANNDAP
jgi:hypothetical protein